jgi:hypothetical protein
LKGARCPTFQRCRTLQGGRGGNVSFSSNSGKPLE